MNVIVSWSFPVQPRTFSRPLNLHFPRYALATACQRTEGGWVHTNRSVYIISVPLSGSRVNQLKNVSISRNWDNRKKKKKMQNIIRSLWIIRLYKYRDVVRFGNYRQRRVIYGDVGTQFVIDRGVILALVGVCN